MPREHRSSKIKAHIGGTLDFSAGHRKINENHWFSSIFHYKWTSSRKIEGTTDVCLNLRAPVLPGHKNWHGVASYDYKKILERFLIFCSSSEKSSSENYRASRLWRSGPGRSGIWAWMDLLLEGSPKLARAIIF